MFITFEGPEGGGKTTQMAALAEYLRTAGWPVLATREPGGTPIGDQIRSVLMSMQNEAMQTRTEILLFQASRAQLVAQVIRPHLQSGGIVLCDRYADSTLAYQGYGYQQFDPAELRPIIEFATGGLQPDLTVLLDLDVTTGLARRMSDGGWNRLDARQLEFHQRVRQGYLALAAAAPQRWALIDASGPPDQVQADIRRLITSRLPPLPISGRGPEA